MKIILVAKDEVQRWNGGYTATLDGHVVTMTDSGKPVVAGLTIPDISYLDTTIYLLPYDYRPNVNGEWYDDTPPARTMGERTIIVGAEKVGVNYERLVLHELGHIFHRQLMNFDIKEMSPEFRKYMELRGITTWGWGSNYLHHRRAEELFADDFAFIHGADEDIFERFGVGLPAAEVQEYIKSFIPKEEEEVPKEGFYTKPLIPAKVQGYIANLYVTRKVTKVHIHHSAIPSKAGWVGEATIRGIYDTHTGERGWQDIGYHFLVDPHGVTWTGRDINIDPASIYGHNDNVVAICMIGNFDTETLEAKQREATMQLVLALLERFKLTTGDIIFHRDLAATNCPGANIDKTDFIGWVEAWQRVEPKKETLIGQVIDDEAKVYLDGEHIGLAPIIDGVSYFPTRAGGEKLGFTVKWQPGRIDLAKEG